MKKKINVKVEDIRKYSGITFSYSACNPDSTAIDNNGKFCPIGNNRINVYEYVDNVYVFPLILKLFQSKIKGYL